MKQTETRLVFSPRNKGLNVGPLSNLKAQGWGLSQNIGPGPTASMLAFAVVEYAANTSGWMGLEQPGPVQGVPACRDSYK